MKNTSFGSLASLLAVLSLAACADVPEEELELAASESALTKTAVLSTKLGTFTVQPPDPTISGLDSQHPWVVDVGGTGSFSCRGVLIHPSWVLTAAHCIGTYAGKVSYQRIDPSTGVVAKGERNFDANGTKRGMFVHPSYVADSGFGQPQNDIGLIRLAQPFTLDRNLQTVSLPYSASVSGRTGTMTTNNHVTLPSGYTQLFRAPQLASCASPNGFFCVNPPAGSMCKGDSGSGFVEQLDGRATVVGIASNISGGDSCVGANGQAQFADVYSYRSWILDTMKMSLQQVAGQVRLRWAGSANAGVMSLTCLSTGAAPIEVPMNAPGAEISMNCDDVRVFCQPAGGNSLTGFRQRTFQNDNSASVAALSFTSSWTAAYADPVNNFLEYTCSVGGTVTVGTTGTVGSYAKL